MTAWLSGVPCGSFILLARLHKRQATLIVMHQEQPVIDLLLWAQMYARMLSDVVCVNNIGIVKVVVRPSQWSPYMAVQL